MYTFPLTCFVPHDTSSSPKLEQPTLAGPQSFRVLGWWPVSNNEGELSMRRTIVIAVLGLMTASIALGQRPSASGDRRGSIEQVIRQLDHERIQAQIDADAAALRRIYAADFIGVGPSGAVRTKPQVISDFTTGELKFQSITTDEVRVRIYGNTALETGRSTMNGQDRGKAVPRDNRFTRVWVKQQGHWRLVLNHYSPLIMQQ